MGCYSLGLGRGNSLSSVYRTVDQGVDDGGHEKRDHVGGWEGREMGVGAIVCDKKSAGEQGGEEEDGVWDGSDLLLIVLRHLWCVDLSLFVHVCLCLFLGFFPSGLVPFV